LKIEYHVGICHLSFEDRHLSVCPRLSIQITDLHLHPQQGGVSREAKTAQRRHHHVVCITTVP